MYNRVASLFVFTTLFFLMAGIFCVSLIHFSQDPTLSGQLHTIESELGVARKVARVQEARYNELRQLAALHLPNIPELRNLNDTLRSPASVLVLNSSDFLFEQGRDYFRVKKYTEAAAVFQSLINEFPTSVHTIPAYFFLGESQYLLKQYESCLQTVEGMVELFPSNELTGHILFRLVDVMMLRGKDRQATQILKVIQKEFAADSELKIRAAQRERELGEIL